MDGALLILRVVVGALLAAHGSQKLFGWFGGRGPAGTSRMLESLGFRPAHPWAVVAGLAEFLGGILFLLGWLSPLGSLGIASSMFIAITKVHWPKVWVTEHGLEYPLVLLTVATAVGIAGPGGFSLDHALGTSLAPGLSLSALVLMVAGWVFALVSTSSPRQTPAATKG